MLLLTQRPIVLRVVSEEVVYSFKGSLGDGLSLEDHSVLEDKHITVGHTYYVLHLHFESNHTVEIHFLSHTLRTCNVRNFRHCSERVLVAKVS